MISKKEDSKIQKNEIIKWNKNISFLKYKNRVIIANRYNGLWLKISRECFEILEKVINYKMTYTEILDIFDENEDRDYFVILLNKLIDINAFVNSKTHTESEIQCVYLLLTHRCNLKCIHCSVDASSIFEDEYLDTEEILCIIDKIVSAKPKVIVFTGGEPLLRKDINIILEHTRKKFFGKITLMTNATLINKDNAKFLTKTIDAIDISIDGVNEETCSRIRGKGVYEKVINAVELLKQHRFNKISLSMVTSNFNKPYLSQFYELNKRLGTTPIERVFAERGRGQHSKDEFVFQSNKNKSKVITKKEYKKNKEELYNTIKACSCGAGKTTFTICYDGNIYPCGLLISDTYRLANIKDIKDLDLLIEHSCSNALSSLEHIQPEKYIKCKNCVVNLFCWTCLEGLDRLKEKKEFEDRCESLKEYLIDTIWETEYE